MYLELGPKVFNDKFSWIICKNPSSSPFIKKIKDGRQVISKFTNNDRLFQTYIKNDSLVFLEKSRQLNLSNYVHTQLSSVCPYNLNAIDDMLHSVIRGNNCSGGHLTDEEFNYKDQWTCVIGPFAKDIEYLEETFKQVDFTVIKLDDPLCKCSSMLKLENNTPISFTEFIQKIYMVSYFLTKEEDLFQTTDENIEKFINLTSNWINGVDIKDKLVKKLSNYKKSFVKMFADSLDEDESAFELKNNLEQFLTKTNLHEKRHKIVSSIVKKNNCKTIIDLGCGSGVMYSDLLKLPQKCHILAMDISKVKVEKIYGKYRTSRVVPRNSNILYPDISENELNPDMLTCVEVIEHLEKKDRLRLLQLIRTIYMPNNIIITTPNVGYNYHFNMDPGTYRRRDHRIEYTLKEFLDEVCANLQPVYDIKFIEIDLEGNDLYKIKEIPFKKLSDGYANSRIPNFFIHGTRIKKQGKKISHWSISAVKELIGVQT